MKTATVSLVHPILFVFDFSSQAFSVPEYDPASAVSANGNGLSIQAVSEVDGEVTVRLTSAIPSAVGAEAHEVFAGSSSRRVAVVTSENEKLLEADLASTIAQVRVMVDDSEFPADIWVEAC